MRARTANVISSEAEKSKIAVKVNHCPATRLRTLTLFARRVMRARTANVISSEAEKSKIVVKGKSLPRNTSPYPDTMRAPLGLITTASSDFWSLLPSVGEG